MSSKELMISKNIRLSFINKGIITLFLGLLWVVIFPLSYIFFAYWSEMPIYLKIFWPISLVIILIGTIVIPFNGLIITKKGTILFLPDFRLKKFNIKNLEKIEIVFSKWENKKYSVMIKFIYLDGKFFYKDYSKQFRNMKCERFIKAMYTINKRKIERICNELLDLDIFVITIVGENKNIIYKSI